VGFGIGMPEQVKQVGTLAGDVIFGSVWVKTIRGVKVCGGGEEYSDH
jgi:tryptophan synthase alpha subunit